jgi:diketogulonate reductase-like aldo/keto reductase
VENDMTQPNIVQLPSARTIPTLGLGTWHMGERKADRAREVAALKAGIDLGLTVIDTAAMYGDGGAEEVVAEAIAGARDKVYLVSKVLPHNASRKGTIEACEQSLQRLKTDRIDLYLLHWRGSYALTDTVAAFESLKSDGKIGDWGVSNFDVDDMAELKHISDHCAANQVLYHLGSRGIEWKLLPDSQRAGIPIIAYCPLGQGELIGHPAIEKIANKHTVSPAAIAIAFLLSKPGVLAIPKSSHAERVHEFAKARDVKLDAEDFAYLDREFPAPKRKTALDIV